MKKYFICIVTLFISFKVFSSTATLDKFDNRVYRLGDTGVKDLAFKVKVNGLTRKIKEQIPTAPISEIYFNVYTIPKYNKFYVEVVGLPKGFKKQEEYLSSLVYPYLDFVNPNPISAKVKGYNLKELKDGDVQKVVAEDKSYQKDVTKIELTFNNDELVSLNALSSQGTANTDYTYQPSANAKGKLLLRKSSQETILGAIKKSSLTLVDYESVEGFVFPKKIEVTESQVAKASSGSGDSEILNQEFKMNLYDFRVNEGVAVKYIANQKDK